ncbi:tRNA lysidine(34) synthetase TilS [Oceanibaculum indicum]|uniref:tRNA(Ile)-lysidine synthase n=1 Tax=Oceanibaculum indicum P24 TaxID=1207063 RepID=K2JQK9_9PROT|nr:tRNA lysidine(34) synthetase TilS [Oceanibaculum indicum]EKE67510.1 tRNA(Ile)-lysidine synthetase, TilS [Oceanibaculum indicum P24]
MPVSGLEQRFLDCLDRLGGFEPSPRLAIAVSGGADSLALTLLADLWARRRGGRAIGLTVDHGLRPDSAAEARQVAGWLAARNIPHHTLAWQGEKPRIGLQAAAREARYRLLEDFCAAKGILHLLLAHHAGDQAETLALRLDAGSGPTGLAGMASIVERPFCRLLRPLLTVSGQELRAYLQQVGQGWIEDPSNRDARFARVRARRALAEDPARQASLLADAARHGSARRAQDRAVARLLARMIVAQPAARALTLDRARLTEAEPAVGRQALVRCLMHVGGQSYPPRQARLDRLWDKLGAGPLDRTATLGGCLLRPERRGGQDRVRVTRETARAGVEALEGRGALPHLNESRMRLGLPTADAIYPYPATPPLAGADFAVAEPVPSVIS